MSTGISAEHSTIEIPTKISHLINEVSSFKAILKDQKENKATAAMASKVIKDLMVEVTGLSKVNVNITVVRCFFVFSPDDFSFSFFFFF